jgi:hypothetical protein
MIKKVLSATFALSLLAAVGLGALVLATDLSSPTQAAPPCEVQCKKEFRECQRFCGRPDIHCFVACETVLDICLANCGAVTQ